MLREIRAINHLPLTPVQVEALVQMSYFLNTLSEFNVVGIPPAYNAQSVPIVSALHESLRVIRF